MQRKNRAGNCCIILVEQDDAIASKITERPDYLMNKVTAYIKNNWDHAIHTPDEQSRGIVKMPRPYSVPCANIKDVFSDFYYWDTYFANLGLMLDGKAEQAENNLDIMAYFIRNIGYVPNANHLLDRSQPPLFTRGVWDLYCFTGEKRILEKYIAEIVKEYRFFQYDRTTDIGLARFGTNAIRSNLREWYSWLSKRVGEYRDTEEEQIQLATDLMAIAESGWDFNPRFHTGERKFAAREFAHLELNCLLYDMEQKISRISILLDLPEQAREFQANAAARKERMERYMLDKQSGVFYDYHIGNQCFSSVTSCASFYPFAVGLSDNRDAAKRILEKLELPFGLSACEYRGEQADYLQWDYPSMWPSNVYFAYVGLTRIGLTEDADRIAEKYLRTVERCFDQTGALWEKYDAKNGIVSVTKEYETPEMMGWTAGVYRYLESCREGNPVIPFE